MTGERYVLLGLARARSRWFGDVARWATSGALPAEFLKVVSIEELRARLQSGRAFSALLVDAALPGCDRDLAELTAATGCALIVVEDRYGADHWQQLGAGAVLAPDFDREQLLKLLRAHARAVSRTDRAVPARPTAPPLPGAWRGRLVAVTGAGGTGRSTLAMALATGLASDPRHRGLVVLADLALRAQQALLHDAGDLVPGLSELVDAHRSATLSRDEIHKLCFGVPASGYDLLLGLRRTQDWAALRPAAFAAALDGLRRTYRLVVADVDADVEGEAECGSVEVEERNLLARVTLRSADLVAVVGLGGLAGTATHVQVMRDLLHLGVRPERMVPVLNRAPRSPRARAESARALGCLLAAASPGRSAPLAAAAPIFVPERRRLDEALRDDGRLPAGLALGVAEPVRALLDPSGARQADDAGAPVPVPGLDPVPVAPGSLAPWSVVSGEDR